MKSNPRMFLLLCLFCLTGQLVMAQKGEGRNVDPEVRAERQTKQMTDKLSLSDAQSSKVGEINLATAQKMKAARAAAKGDREQMKATMTGIRDEHKAALQEVLTEDQYKQWLLLEEMRRQQGPKNKKGKKDKKGKKKPPPPPPAPENAPEQGSEEQ